MKYILMFLIGLPVFGCSQIKKFGEGVQKDTKENFNLHKEFIVGISFKGLLLKKKLCEHCDINEYQLQLRLNELTEKPDLSRMQYQPYYFFEGDSLLTITVPKKSFEAVKEGEMILKNRESFSLTVVNPLPYLNKKKYKWLDN